jgi:hypothetical protein
MKQKFTLQYASNFFLNLHKRRDFQNILIPSSENIAILGNINSLDSIDSKKDYKIFLKYLSSNWKNVYLVPGPYEYVSRKPILFKNKIEELQTIREEFKNLTILNNTNISVPKTDITLVGSTLWVKEPYYRNPCCFEFSYIHKIKRDMRVGQIIGNDIKEWFLEDTQLIRDLTQSNKKTIVLTHHLPSLLLTNQTKKTRMEASYLEPSFFKYSIPIWLGGAGSRTVSATFGLTHDTLCAVNTYTTFDNPELVNTNYNPKAVISLRVDTIDLY